MKTEKKKKKKAFEQTRGVADRCRGLARKLGTKTCSAVLAYIQLKSTIKLLGVSSILSCDLFISLEENTFIPCQFGADI